MNETHFNEWELRFSFCLQIDASANLIAASTMHASQHKAAEKHEDEDYGKIEMKLNGFNILIVLERIVSKDRKIR